MISPLSSIHTRLHSHPGEKSGFSATVPFLKMIDPAWRECLANFIYIILDDYLLPGETGGNNFVPVGPMVFSKGQ
jgi:hypothetical protein